MLSIYFILFLSLQKSKLKLKFVTNTTKECKRSLHERLIKLGFHIDIKDIFTSLTAARYYVEQLKVRPMLLLEEQAKEDFQGKFVKFLDLNLISVFNELHHYWWGL